MTSERHGDRGVEAAPHLGGERSLQDRFAALAFAAVHVVAVGVVGVFRRLG
eukprot:CAMPEP_0180331098 /NCGR_PEP_ID=MMETSP0988-20121125/41719_1 /TAXON_ID=697907 /ORGANISM="non described non described, Strain CCMP2293" /LENGTH=50 /DNA_ID=CAMNT_0022318457 /DNA_START=381 /DNA_END=530 /DNA_ORIENTATION=+